MKFWSSIITIFFCIFCNKCLAQDFADKNYYLVDSLNLEQLSNDDLQLLDSALRTYHEASIEIDRINALVILQENMMHDDWAKYNMLVKQMVENNLENARGEEAIYYSKVLGDAYNNQGFDLQSLGDNKKALESHLIGLNYYKRANYQEGIASVFLNVGFIYENSGNIHKALKYYNNSLRIFSKEGNRSGSAEARNNIASLYTDQGEYERASKLFKENLAYFSELGNKKGIAIASNNLGEISLKQLNDVPSALKYYNKSLLLAKELGSKIGQATTYDLIGAAYMKGNILDSALISYKNALSLFESIENKRGMAHAKINIGIIYFELGKTTEASEYVHAGMDIGEELGFPDIIGLSAEMLTKIYELKEDYKKAYRYFQLSVQMQDSIKNKNTEKLIIQNEANHQLELKQRELSIKEKNISILNQEKETKNYMIISLCLFIALVLIGGLIFFRWYQQRKRLSELEIRHQLDLYIREVDGLKGELSKKEMIEEKEVDFIFGDKLSSRELEVFKELVKAKTNQEIAETLFISLSTVKTHLMKIYEKLEVKNRSQAIKKFATTKD